MKARQSAYVMASRLVSDASSRPVKMAVSPLKEAVKAIAFVAATVLIAPLLVSYWLRAALVGRDRALEGSSQTLSLVPGLIGQYVRRAFFARTLASFHRTATIEFGVLLSKADTRIDEFVYVGPRCHLGLVHLQRDVLLGPAVQIPSGGQTHGIADLGHPIREQAGIRTLIRVGAGTWIGAGAIVMASVGCDSVVAAAAVVTHPIPDRVIAAGVPARVVRERE